MSTVSDRRAERRRTIQGEGIITVAEPLPLIIRCRLLDTSGHGFRASHDCAELLAGSQVQLESASTGKVTARVIWTAIMGDHIESGFYILS
jgi:hypothetical protein